MRMDLIQWWAMGWNLILIIIITKTTAIICSTRNIRSTCPSNLRVDGAAGTASFLSKSAKGDWEDNRYNQPKGSNTGQVAPQCAYDYSLPWYRTILDVSLEEKPWSHPGANISDTMFAVFDKYDPKGRAIEVESSIDEHQHSMDIRHACFWDSDVVIQINVQDSAEDYFGSGKEKLGLKDSNSSARDDGNGDLEQDFSRDVHHCGSVSEDEPPDDDGIGNVSNGDGYHHHKLNVCTSVEIEAMETFDKADKAVDKNPCKSYSCSMETELSLGNRSHFSPSPTCSGSDIKLLKDSIHCHPAKISSPLRRQSLNSSTEFQESVRSDHKNSINNGIKTKLGDWKYI